jgi:hypothetical protein
MHPLLHYAISCGLPLQAVGQAAVGRSRPGPRWHLWVAYGVLVLSALVFAKRVVNPGIWSEDFNKAYYRAGQLLFSRPYDLYVGVEGDFVNIPIVALPFVPLASLPLARAQLCFALGGVSLVAAACWLLVRLTRAGGRDRLAIIGLFVLSGPLHYSIREGNLSHYVLFLLTAALLCLENRRELGGGAFLALAAVLKLPLLLFGVYYLLRGRWRVLAGFSAALLVLAGASVLSFGLDLHLYWYRTCIGPFAGKPLTAYNVQSLSSCLARLFSDNGLVNFRPVAMGWDYRATNFLLLGLICGAAAWVCRAAPPAAAADVRRLEFCIVLCLAVVVSPLAWTHYYLFLILPCALYLGGGLAVPRGAVWLGAAALALALMAPPPVLLPSGAPWARLFTSHHLFGGLVLLGLLLAARRKLPGQSAARPAAPIAPGRDALEPGARARAQEKSAAA